MKRLALALLALAPLAALAAEDDIVKVFGKAKTVAKGAKVIEVRDQRGTYGVSTDETTEVMVGKPTPLKDMKGFAQIHILGVKSPSGKPEIAVVNEVRALVAADQFTPPPVPADLQKKNIAWHTGALDGQDGVYRMETYRIDVRPERNVAVLTAGKLEDVAKEKLLYVEAKPIGAKTSKQVAAKKVVVCGDGIGAEEWKLVLRP